jgi:hypothetical protein
MPARYLLLGEITLEARIHIRTLDLVFLQSVISDNHAVSTTQASIEDNLHSEEEQPLMICLC